MTLYAPSRKRSLPTTLDGLGSSDPPDLRLPTWRHPGPRGHRQPKSSVRFFEQNIERERERETGQRSASEPWSKGTRCHRWPALAEPGASGRYVGCDGSGDLRDARMAGTSHAGLRGWLATTTAASHRVQLQAKRAGHQRPCDSAAAAPETA